jgi:Spy/CpxP family protein refolding chaperone
MNSRIMAIGLIVASLILAYGFGAYAQGKGKGPGPGKGLEQGKAKGAEPGKGCGCGMHHGFGKGGGILPFLAKNLDELALTADQKDKIKKLRTDAKEKMKTLMESKQAIVKAIVTELKKDKPDKKVLTAKHDEIKKLMGQKMDIHFDMMLNMYNVLTKEQKKKLWEIVDAKAPCMGGKGPCKGPCGDDDDDDD